MSVTPTHPGSTLALAASRFVVADAQSSTRELHAAILRQLGAKVVTTGNGREVLELIERERPDCVFLRMHLPEVDGLSVCRQIRERFLDRYVTVIFLITERSEARFAQCLEAGADDCLTTPLASPILIAKLVSFARIRAMHESMQTQQRELEAHRAAIENEHQLAKELLAKVLERGESAQNVRRMIVPAEAFHGDIVLTAWGPDRVQYVLIGDFTGHGLQAALGAIPVADIFHSMTRVGFAVAEIVAEINKRLNVIMPPGLFLSACLLEIHHGEGIVVAWNGGLPPVYLHRAGVGIVGRIDPQHVPLAIQPPSRFDSSCASIPIRDGDTLIAYSDGLIETVDEGGEHFGDERLVAVLSKPDLRRSCFDELVQRVEEFRGGVPRFDDVTLVEIACGASVQSVTQAKSGTISREPLKWKFSLELEGRALRHVDPVPLCMRAVQELQGLEGHKEALHLVLSELYNNALDHGVLGRDSSAKDTPEGFIEYYAGRESQLEHLDHGRIVLDLAHTPTADGAELVLEVSDSGTGFERAALPNEGRVHSGRGIALVESFCRSLEYLDGGRRARAHYVWNAHRPAEPSTP